MLAQMLRQPLTYQARCYVGRARLRRLDLVDLVLDLRVCLALTAPGMLDHVVDGLGRRRWRGRQVQCADGDSQIRKVFGFKRELVHSHIVQRMTIGPPELTPQPRQPVAEGLSR